VLSSSDESLFNVSLLRANRLQMLIVCVGLASLPQINIVLNPYHVSISYIRPDAVISLLVCVCVRVRARAIWFCHVRRND